MTSGPALQSLTDPEISAGLEALAEQAGIEPFYWDIWGNRRETSAETRQALLAAMGFAVATAAEVAASRLALATEAWRKPLPPVVVTRTDAALTVPLVLPDVWRAATAHWRLETETGAVLEASGAVRVEAALETAEEPLADGGLTRLMASLPDPLDKPEAGYHTLRLTLDPGSAGAAAATFPRVATCRLIVATPQAPAAPSGVGGGAPCGVGVQVYALHSAGSWGVGDLADLAMLVRQAAAAGADLVGINPLHALFLADPEHISPYSPSHRQFLNPLYLAVPAMADFAESERARAYVATPAFQSALAAARAGTQVDWPAVQALKLPVLRLLWQDFQSRHLAEGQITARGAAFRAFQAEHGESLTRFALFEALHGHFYGGEGRNGEAGRNGGEGRNRETGGNGGEGEEGASRLWSWHAWPAAFQDPASPAVAAFAAAHVATIGFHQYLQWQTEIQLAHAAATARTAGMRIGLYRDLAVADHPDGAAAWARTATVLPAVNVGAPPDAFSPLGQNWGLSPLSPVALRESGYAPFIAALRANLRHAGALRIDHAMGLWHLFWIPAGPWAGRPGTYVRYPFADLFRILTLEASRHNTVLIGEDLGTVPDGFRPAMAEAAILAYKVMYFERHYEGRYNPSFWYPELALVTVTTHDLPTLRGFWEGRDIDWRDRLGQYPTPEARQQALDARTNDRWKLLDALRNEGLLPPELAGGGCLPPFSPALALAVYRWLARTPCRIRMLQMEDALDEAEQPNLPGTIDTHPNWRRRLGLSLEAMADAATLTPFLAALGGRL